MAAAAAATDCRLTAEERTAALERHNSDLARRDGLLRGVAEASRLLLAGTDLVEAMSAAASVLGACTGCDRVVIYRYEDKGEESAWWVEALWEGPGVIPLLQVHGRDSLRTRALPNVCEMHRSGRPWISRTRDLPANARAYNEAIGALSNAKMPVLADGEYWGFVAFTDCSGERDWTAGDIHALEGVGAILGAAVARAKRESEHREALAAERERAARERAAELAEANEALSRSVARLASHDEMDVFLAGVLQESVRITGAASGGVFVHDADDVLRARAVVLRGELIDLAADERAQGLREVAAADACRIWSLVRRQNRVHWFDAETHDRNDPLQWRTFHAHGHRHLAVIPMAVNTDVVGFLGLAFDGAAESLPGNVKLERCRTFAQQATLAVRLCKLGEQAKHAAIAQERESLASARAAELSAAAAALRRTGGHLAQSPELNTFVHEVLSEATHHTGAAGGALFRYDAAADALTLHAAVTDRAIDLETDARFAALRQPVPSSSKKSWARLVNGEPVLCDISAAGGSQLPEIVEFHRLMEYRYSMAVPILIGASMIGCMVLWFTACEPDDCKIELVQALAQQTAVAIHLSELAARSRQAAVLEERAGFARELHDTLLQGFTGVTLQLRALLRRMPEERDMLFRVLAGIERESTEAVQEARRAVGDMRGKPVPMPPTHDLAAALVALVDQSEATARARLGWRIVGERRPAPTAIGLPLLRIAREAIRNAVRHGRPQSVQTVLAFEPGRLVLTVEDDGCGFDLERVTAARNGHFGLLGIEERAASIGGRCRIESEPGRGTRIRVEAPL
jgi:signal transduction histidine kinase